VEVGVMRRLIEIAWSPIAALLKPPPVPDTTPEIEAVEREIEMDDIPESVRLASLFVDGDWEYCLGAGKIQIGAPHWTRCAKPTQHRHRHAKTDRVFSDCSGFLTAMWGIPRQLPDGTWLNTDEMERMARLHPVSWDERRPGDGVVYGAGLEIGHCGLYAGNDQVIHCSASGRRAVKRGGLDFWVRKGALILRPELAGLLP
jgi:hypothetical protein